VKIALITALVLLTSSVAMADGVMRQIPEDNVSAACWPPFGGCTISQPGNWMSMRCPVVGSEKRIALLKEIEECEVRLAETDDAQQLLQSPPPPSISQ